jgi:hypothetical protein
MQAITIPPSLGVRGLKINFNVRFKSINDYPNKVVLRQNNYQRIYAIALISSYWFLTEYDYKYLLIKWKNPLFGWEIV